MGAMAYDVSPLSLRPSPSGSDLQKVRTLAETTHLAVFRRRRRHGQHEGTAEHRQETGQRRVGRRSPNGGRLGARER